MVGPFDLLVYLGIFFSTVWTVVKLDNLLVMAALLAVICYHVWAVVNISEPISALSM